MKFWALALSSAAATRLEAYDHPSVLTTSLGCWAAPQSTCYAYSAGDYFKDVSTNDTDPGMCCALCNADAECDAWSHDATANPARAGSYFRCHLFASVPSGTSYGNCSVGRAANQPPPTPSKPRGTRPNIIFLVVESTDGRTWTPGYQNDAVPLPNFRELQKGGLNFRKHYANAPVCCPSRATFWSGRHASNIPHEHNGIAVGGAWNNYEGLPSNFTQRIDQVMSAVSGYNVKVNGKTDWATGGHSENVRLSAWTMNVPFPYDVNASGGWVDETMCGSNGTITKGTTPKTSSAHKSDWKVADDATSWIETVVAATPEVPFFVFSGMSIVHPPYATNEYWSSQIDRSKIDVPAWKPLMEMHPCDFQSSMLKGCTPSDADASEFYDVDRRREIRSLYLAMVAEWDAMVGQYMETVKKLGIWNETVFIVTSDHGDMQMEHQQFYKMVPYDASASVPMIIYDGRPGHQTATPMTNVDLPTQLIDIFPTILELAQVEKSAWPAELDGFSLVPMLPSPGGSGSESNAAGSVAPTSASAAATPHPDFVVSQFHGDNIAMSWFLIVKKTSARTVHKLIIWGTGAEVPSLLFELNSDPSENANLIATKAGLAAHRALVDSLSAQLLSVVNYPAVALSVANYGRDSFNGWVASTPGWRDALHSKLRWDDSWNASGTAANLKALGSYMNASSANATITPCRLALKWPSVDQ
jgi:arylsulfatase A-like enzyme